MKKLSKNKKIILITSIAVGGLLITYFGGSMIATASICNNLYGHRSYGSLDTPYYFLQKNRNDYESLEDRKEIEIDHGKIKLQGYLYETPYPSGLVIAAHGINSFADGDHAQYQDYFVNHNWDVLSFDMTGCGNSEGSSMKGLYESRFCVDSVLNYVSNDINLKDLPICMIGHSWGAYGITSSSKNHEKVCAIAALSGFNAPNEMMIEYVANLKSKGLYIGKPGLDMSLGLYEGNKVYFEATKEIKKHPDINYMIVQGSLDDVVFYNASIYSKLEKKCPDNIQLEYLDGATHIGVWRTNKANAYYNEIRAQYDSLKKQYNGDIPEDVLNNFLIGIDKNRSSELNLELMNKINDLFLNSVSK